MSKELRKGVDHTGVCVVFICHDGEGNFVMARRNSNTRDEHGKWDIGGGAVDFDQEVEESLKKKIQEEYCSTVLDFGFLGYRDVHREHEGKKTHWVALDFIVLVDRSKVKNGEPHKFDEVAWFTLETMPKEVHSQFPTFLDLHKDKLDL